MGMEGFNFEPKKEMATIRANEDGTFDVSGLDQVMKSEVDAMRAGNPEIDTTLRMIETPNMSKGIKLKMKEYLDEIKPDFNWGLYLEIESEQDPTIH
jgi:hypothetical protein